MIIHLQHPPISHYNVANHNYLHAVKMLKKVDLIHILNAQQLTSKPIKYVGDRSITDYLT